MGHFGEHDFVGGAGVAGEDEAFGEGGIETAMFGFGEPDEVFRTVIGSDPIEVVTIVGMESSGGKLRGWRKPFDRSGSNESEGYSMVKEDVPIAVRHLEVLLLAVAVKFVGFGGVEDRFDGVILKTVVPGCFVFDTHM